MGQTIERRLCACGSGLSAARCCGMDVGLLGASDAHRHLLPLEAQAEAALLAGEAAEAERLAQDVLELAPGRIGPLSVLFRICRQSGRTAAAEALLRRIVRLDPNNFWATADMAHLLLSKGALAESELHARNAVRIAPENAQAHNLMGMILTEANRPIIGEFHFRRALDLAGARDPVVLSNLALCLKNQGKMAEARALYRESLQIAPDSLHTLLGLARLEEADRNLDEAASLLDRAEALAPGNAAVALARAVVWGRQRNAPAAVALLDRLAREHAGLGVGELLEKGRLLDKMGQYGEAFAAYTEGKARLREVSGHQYLAAHAESLVGKLKRFFVAKRLRTFPVAPVREAAAQPLFVLGFPRSGTTLMEQTLSAHARIAAGDELPLIAELTELMPRMLDSPLAYPEALAELWMGDHCHDLETLRDYYLQKVSRMGIVGPGEAWFTDKMPLNETHLGLIGMMFPQSPLVHVIRHPLDVVLSVFSNLLTHGFYCSYALETAAAHYMLIEGLVGHYRQEMQLRYLAVKYEDLVRAQEKTVRTVLDFVGEGFEAQCLRFHENRRYARTASYAQVSESLYDRSCYRYRHYLRELQPIIAVLRPAIERLGYEV